MADIVIIDPETNKPKVEETPKETVSENNVSAPVTEELQKDAVYRIMGLDSYEDQHKYRSDVDVLLDWVKAEKPNPSREDIKWALRELEVKLGTPPLAEKKISYFTRFAYLELEGRKLEAEKKMFRNQPKFDKRGL